MTTILTITAIESTVPKGLKGQQIELIDDREFGLRLRVGARGAKWSALSRLPSGERLRVPLGSWPRLGIAEARRQAQAAKRSIELGENLNQKRRAARDHIKTNELIETYYQLKLSHLRTGGMPGDRWCACFVRSSKMTLRRLPGSRSSRHLTGLR
jgi:Arm DNA-binding domain